MATALKLKSVVLGIEPALSSLVGHVRQSLVKKNLTDKIELSQVDVVQTTEKSLIQNLSSSNTDIILANSEVIRVFADPLIKYLCSDNCTCRYVQFTYAGVNFFMDRLTALKQAPPKSDVCRYCGYFGKHMAEYVIGQMISRERGFLTAAENQKRHIWDSSKDYRTLKTLSIGILGVGEIGTEIAKFCKMFGMTVWGLSRETNSPHVDHYRQLDKLHELMESCDYICNILPSTPETRGLLTLEHFQYCSKKKSVFINVGRGDVTSDDIIVQSINNGWLGGAIMDVFEKEPLPKDSPLWDHPKVTISPHNSACTHFNEIAEMFTEQLERMLVGQELLYKVDFTKGY